jgi:hypothetical protein
MHHYRILKEKNTVLVILEGEVTLQTFFEVSSRIVSDQNFKSYYTILIDFRWASLCLSLRELKKAAEKYSQIESFKGPKVMLVNRSVDTAKIMIFRNHVGLDERFCIYSTLDGASSFLQIDLSLYLYEDNPVREDLYIEG